MAKQVIWLFVIANAAVTVIACISSGKSSSLISAHSRNISVGKLYDIIKTVNRENIIYYNVWETDSPEILHCIIARYGKPKYLGDPRDNLLIYNSKGELLYQDESGGQILNIEFKRVMRNLSSQMIIHKNQGGKLKELQIFDYLDGEIKEILVEGFITYYNWCEIRPSYRAGGDSSNEPFQVITSNEDDVSLSGEIVAEVFRYKNGKYRRVGKFNQTEIDNQIEKMLGK